MTVNIRARIGRAGSAHPLFKGEWFTTDRRTGTTRAFVYITPEEQTRYSQRRPFMLRSRYNWNQAHPDALLRKGEIIHHRDENPLNDDPANLERMPSQRHHAHHHFSQPRGPMSPTHREALSRAKRAKRAVPPKGCDNCGNALTRIQILDGGRFCCQPCHYTFRTGKSHTGW